MNTDEILDAIERLQALEHDRRGMQIHYSSDHYTNRIDELLKLLDGKMKGPASIDTSIPALPSQLDQPVAVGNDGMPF